MYYCLLHKKDTIMSNYDIIMTYLSDLHRGSWGTYEVTGWWEIMKDQVINTKDWKVKTEEASKKQTGVHLSKYKYL